MIPVHCRIKHDPENGAYGDCFRACVASILELDAEAVPHFFHDKPSGDEAMNRARAWLNERQLTLFATHFDGANSLDDILAMQAAQNPDAFYILFIGIHNGESGGDHVVVCRGGKIVHDPAWYPTPPVGPGSHGLWTLMVLARV